MNRIMETVKKHPALMIVAYWIVCGWCIENIRDVIEKFLMKWAVDGLLGGLISFSAIGYLILGVMWSVPIIIVIYVYVMSKTATRLITKKPKLCNALFGISRFLVGFYVLISVLAFIKNMKALLTGTVDYGYAADFAVILFNIVPYLYGIGTFFLVSVIFADSDKPWSEEDA